MARGVAVFYTRQMQELIWNIECDSAGRYILIDVMENKQLITIAAIYAPNEDCPSFFGSLQEKLVSRSEHKIVIGDFNLTMDVDLDRLNTYCNNNRAKEKVEEIMEAFCLKDLWRVRNGDVREYSWRKKGNIQKASRIDLALVSGGLDQNVKEICYLIGIMSDHRAIYMVVDMMQFERGRGFWKFNNTLLKNEEFLKIMNRELDTLFDTISGTQIQKWEIIKTKVKKCAADFSKNKVEEDKVIIGNLSEIVQEYESQLPLPESDYELLEKTKADLEAKQ